MNCTNILDSGQPCGDEGHVCDKHAAEAMAEHAYLRHVPRHMVINDAQSSADFDQALIDSGRGYLLLDRDIDQHDRDASEADHEREEIWS
jgi:hypothetical protein